MLFLREDARRKAPLGCLPPGVWPLASRRGCRWHTHICPERPKCRGPKGDFCIPAPSVGGSVLRTRERPWADRGCHAPRGDSGGKRIGFFVLCRLSERSSFPIFVFQNWTSPSSNPMETQVRSPPPQLPLLMVPCNYNYWSGPFYVRKEDEIFQLHGEHEQSISSLLLTHHSVYL